MRRVAFDLEANGLLYAVTKIHCIACVDIDTERERFFGPEEIDVGISYLMDSDVVVAHNLCGYDKPALEKLGYCGSGWPVHTDTLTLSQLFEPDRGGGHSIDAWASEFGMLKPAHDDWSVYSLEMGHRCREDAKICAKVFKRLEPTLLTGEWDKAVQLEQTIAELHAQQVLNGVCFDRAQAQVVYLRLDDEIQSLHASIHAAMPPVVEQTKTQPVKPFKADGSHSVNATKWMGEDVEQAWGVFNRVNIHSVNLASPVQVKAVLLDMGWVPIEYTKKGSPKLTEDSFDSIRGELGQQLARYMVLSHRKKLIFNINKQGERKGLVSSIRDDGRIPADGMTLGTPTGRYTHRTVVNIPSNDAVYGPELRGLFIAAPGHLLVGTDARSLEARMEGHFTAPYDGGAYARELLTGNIHEKNAAVWGVGYRPAKCGKYALTYGCYPPKLAETLGIPKKQGQKAFDAFWEANAALASLTKDVKNAWKKNGYVRGIDGRRLYPRFEHSAVNFLFQNAGSMVVKAATCFMWQGFREHGLANDIKQVIHMHDEIQFEVREDADLELIKRIIKESWNRAGEYYKLNVEIDGDVSVGHSWATTH